MRLFVEAFNNVIVMIVSKDLSLQAPRIATTLYPEGISG